MPSSANATIHQGAVAPYALRYDVTSDDPITFDLSTVTAASFYVLRESGKEDVWPVSLSLKTTTSVRLSRIFQATDVPDAELLTIEPRLTAPTGVFICEPRTLRVRKRYT